jgi:hypothetical protein
MQLTPLRPPRFSRPRAATAAAAVLSLLTAAATMAALAAAPPAGAASTPSAQSLYQAALKAAGGENVHFASSATQDGVSIDVDGDTGNTSGAQTLTVTKGKTVEHVRAMVVGSTGYINGNETALHNVIGLTTKQAHTYAGKWLSFPTSNTALATLVQGLLTSQVPDELQMGGPFTYGPPTMVDGERALAVHGFVSTDSGSKIDVVLYVPASGSPLPIEELTNPGAKSSSDIHGSVAFSKWGEKTAETAPGSSMSLLKLTPAQTSGATSTTSTTSTTAPG